MQKIKIALVLSLIFCHAARASEIDGWISIQDDKEAYLGLKKESLEITKNKEGATVYTIIAQSKDKKSGKVDIGKAYVSADDCTAQAGNFYTLSIDGKVVTKVVPFAFGGQNWASVIATMICGAAAKTAANAAADQPTEDLSGKAL